VGTTLSITLSVPASARPLEVKGEVRWIVDSADDEREHGMGVKFGGLDVDQLLALSDYFASLTAASETDEA
jgi:hypothetical protein